MQLTGIFSLRTTIGLGKKKNTEFKQTELLLYIFFKIKEFSGCRTSIQKLSSIWQIERISHPAYDGRVKQIDSIFKSCCWPRFTSLLDVFNTLKKTLKI